jgi:triosephosphate isomerase
MGCDDDCHRFNAFRDDDAHTIRYCVFEFLSTTGVSLNIMRMPIIAGNWKMNKTPAQAAEFVRALLPELEGLAEAERVVCPPFVAIPAVQSALQNTSIKVGAQNVHTETHGAYTGSVSAPMLQGLVEYVIVGHSEVRQYQHDTDEQINRKVKILLQHGLKPILAVGESLAQNEAGETEAFVGGQVRADLAGIAAADMPKIVIAYEPIWAIGTGRSASASQANAIIGMIRKTVAELFGADVAETVRIQYGGSVKPDNMREYMSQPDIDGALVGGASLNVADFVALTRIAIEASRAKTK